MRFGLILSLYDDYADARVVAEHARAAEAAGWDGVFVWDHIHTATSPGSTGTRADPLADPWITLTAIALATERIRFGPMVTPLPRRRPWMLARQTVTLDHLSGGRLILGLGAGFPTISAAELAPFREEVDARVRAEMLDEGLDVLTGLWSGEPFRYQGRHYQLEEVSFLPTPLQSPRIPIWIAATLPYRAPIRRAARWDGIRVWNPAGPITADLVREVATAVNEWRATTDPFDIVVGGSRSGSVPGGAHEYAQALAAAGATWWIEGLSPVEGNRENRVRRIRQGPPRL